MCTDDPAAALDAKQLESWSLQTSSRLRSHSLIRGSPHLLIGHGRPANHVTFIFPGAYKPPGDLRHRSLRPLKLFQGQSKGPNSRSYRDNLHRARDKARVVAKEGERRVELKLPLQVLDPLDPTLFLCEPCDDRPTELVIEHRKKPHHR